MEFEFKHTRLNNGLEIIGELNRGAKSVSLAYVVLTGARDERPEEYGMSHFLEHMAFKGSEKRSAEDVNRQFDEIGAIHNAYTTEEVTAFWAAVLPEYMEPALDLLSDILRPALREQDFEMEKKVILEEIRMYRDEPVWVLYDAAVETYFAGHPLGHSVLGTEETVGAMTVDQMRQFHAERYRTGNILLAATGNFDWDRLVALAERFTKDWPEGTVDRNLVQHRPPTVVRVIPDDRVQHGYLVALSPAPASTHDLADVADVLAVAVGHGTGSRLFFELVEPGHADSAELERHGYFDTGVFLSYLTCTPSAVPENLGRMLRVYQQVSEQGLSADEVDRVRRKVGSRIVLSAETPSGRLSSLASEWVYRRRYRSVDDLLRDVQNIGEREIRDLLAANPLRPFVVLALGPVDEAGLRQAVEDVYGEASVRSEAS